MSGGWRLTAALVIAAALAGCGEPEGLLEPRVSLSTDAATVNLAPGGEARVDLRLAPRGGLAELGSPAARLVAEGLPDGVEAVFAPAELSGGEEGEVYFLASANAVAGERLIEIRASLPRTTATTRLRMVIEP